jgi:hypothetical protein
VAFCPTDVALQSAFVLPVLSRPHRITTPGETDAAARVAPGQPTIPGHDASSIGRAGTDERFKRSNCLSPLPSLWLARLPARCPSPSKVETVVVAGEAKRAASTRSLDPPTGGLNPSAAGHRGDAADSLVGPTNVAHGMGAEPRGRRAAKPPP